MDTRELDAVRLLAYAFIEAGKFAQARDLLLGVVEAAPEDVFARRNLLLARLRLGEFDEALPLARTLARTALNTDRVPALFFQAYALWGMGRREECREVVDRYAACLKEVGAAAKKPNKTKRKK